MTTQPNEALVEKVWMALKARMGVPARIPTSHLSIGKGDIRAIIPIVQKACEGEIVEWLRAKAEAHGNHAKEAAIDLLKDRQITAQAVALNWADAIERVEYRK